MPVDLKIKRVICIGWNFKPRKINIFQLDMVLELRLDLNMEK